MANYQLLQTKVAEFVGGETRAQIMTALNNKVDTGYIPIPVDEVRRYLFINMLWLEIKAAGTISAQMMIDALASFPEFDLSDAANLAAINVVLDGLVSDELVPSFNVTHKSNILALGTKMLSWADQNWPGDVTEDDLIYVEGMV